MSSTNTSPATKNASETKSVSLRFGTGVPGLRQSLPAADMSVRSGGLVHGYASAERATASVRTITQRKAASALQICPGVRPNARACAGAERSRRLGLRDRLQRGGGRRDERYRIALSRTDFPARGWGTDESSPFWVTASDLYQNG